MNNSAILLGILPLILFVIVDSFASLKAALITAIIAALLEGVMSIYFFKELDFVTGFSIILVILTALISYKKRNDKFIKFQPVILSGVLGVIFIISYYMGHPIIYEMMTKYAHLYPPELKSQMTHPIMIELFKLFTLIFGYGLFVHGALTAWVALKLSNWWWIAMRGIGFYAIMGLSFYITRSIVMS